MSDNLKEDSKEKVMTDFLKQMNKEFGENSFIRIGEDTKRKIDTISSTSPLIDQSLGGGYAKGRIVEVYGGESSGKAQPLSEPVLTPRGFVQMGALCIGDRVISPSGTTTEVVGIYPQGVQDVYKVVFEGGSYTRCTADHLWEVYDVLTGKKSILPLEDLIGVQHTYYTISSNSVDLEGEDFPENYALWATNVMAGNIKFDEVLSKEFICGSSNYRRTLLETILEEDCVAMHSKNKSTEYLCPSKEGAKLVMYLAQSVGYEANLVLSSPRYVIVTKRKNYNREIIDIVYDGLEECQCIKVANSDGLYVTRNFIPTHNTTLSLGAVTSVQKNGGKAAFIDMEHALDLDYAGQLGVNVEDLYLSQPSCAEEALNIAEKTITSGLFDLVIIDSVAALVPRKELEGESGDSVMGLQARLMSQACRKFVGIASKTNTTVFFINQTRQKIGVLWGNPTTTSGGTALKFYASQRIETAKGTPIKNEAGEQIGHELRIKVVKNKIAPPFKNTTVNLIYGRGFDEEAEIIQVASDKGIIERKGSWYSYEGTKLGQGLNNTIDLLRENPELLEEIRAKIAI